MQNRGIETNWSIPVGQDGRFMSCTVCLKIENHLLSVGLDTVSPYMSGVSELGLVNHWQYVQLHWCHIFNTACGLT